MSDVKTLADFKRVLDYNQITGLFTWRVRLGGGAVAGSTAGYKDADGYIFIRAFGKLYRAHRLAWLFLKGAWPTGDIDHHDCNPSNNAELNLREASHSNNLCNRGKQSNNTSGFKGVTFDKQTGRFKAQIGIGNINVSLGRHATKELAFAAYTAAAKELHGEFHRTI